jgi:hypothetical protein
MTTSAPHSTPASRLPLPVRLVDMRALEDRYLAASPDERMAMHTQLAFFDQLSDEERFALDRRFHGSWRPDAADATEACVS